MNASNDQYNFNSGGILNSAQFGLKYCMEPEERGVGCVCLNKKLSRTSVMKDSYCAQSRAPGCLPNLELLVVLDPIIYPGSLVSRL